MPKYHTLCPFSLQDLDYILFEGFNCPSFIHEKASSPVLRLMRMPYAMHALFLLLSVNNFVSSIAFFGDIDVAGLWLSYFHALQVEVFHGCI